MLFGEFPQLIRDGKVDFVIVNSAIFINLCQKETKMLAPMFVCLPPNTGHYFQENGFCAFDVRFPSESGRHLTVA